jgi:hypothetical protein
VFFKKRQPFKEKLPTKSKNVTVLTSLPSAESRIVKRKKFVQGKAFVKIHFKKKEIKFSKNLIKVSNFASGNYI